MRFLTLILVLSVSLAFGAVLYTNAPGDLGQVVPGGGYTCLPPPSNDILWENPFDFALCTNGYNSSDGYRCDDDFVLDDDATIEGFTCWSIFTGGHPQPFEVTVWVDSGGAPGDEVWSETISDVTDTDTGYSGWGYTMYQTDMVPADTFDLDAGTYWVEFFWTSSYFYWLVENGGNFRQNGSPMGVSGFFAVSGGSWYPEFPPYVRDMNPDDGDTGVSVDTDIVFYCVCDIRPVDTDTIVFTVEDQSLRPGGRVRVSDSALAVGRVNPHPAGEISGTLDIDDTDRLDVVCTFTPDEDLPVDLIRCTVAAGLADDRGNETADDFIWTFTTGNYSVEDTTWGAIKAGL
ncbi:MAG TPA: Ig-like domain-containing protein [bacterium]|nr:Ig-like domain-containing protein [bacterium]